MPKPDPTETMTLSIGGVVYAGWQDIRLTRAIDRMATHFALLVTEAWPGQTTPWQIHKFDPCTIKIGADLVLTGYVDAYEPEYDCGQHRVRIMGRSRTMDVIDCTPRIASGQFSGFALDAIATTIAGTFGVAVVTQTDVGSPFADASIYKHETGFMFLERLARLRAVLLCDDEQGRLVLTRCGSARANDSLIQNRNIQRAGARLDGCRQFSDYFVETQTGEAGDTWGGAGGVGAPSSDAPVAQASPVTNVAGSAHDPTVPRFRPHTIIGEAALSPAGAQARADWEMRYAQGRSTQAHVTVSGWRQSNGALWTVNTIAGITSPFLQLDRELLIACVTYRIDARLGRVTDLTLGPPEAYTPDPGEVRARRQKGGAATDWNGAGGT